LDNYRRRCLVLSEINGSTTLDGKSTELTGRRKGSGEISYKGGSCRRGVLLLLEDRGSRRIRLTEGGDGPRILGKEMARKGLFVNRG